MKVPVLIKVLNEVLIDEDGNALPFKNRQMAFRDACIQSLLTPLRDDDEKVKLDKYDLYKKFRDAPSGEITIDTEEVETLKKAAGKVQPQIILGQMNDLLSRINEIEPTNKK